MLTQQLAEFVSETRTGDIPPAGLETARDALVDTLGVALAGSRDPASRIALAYASSLGSVSQSSIWGEAAGTSPAEAAFVNGVFAHAMDFDDSLPSLRGHPSSTILPASIAIAEITGASGEDLLAAYVLAVEVAGKLGRALGHGHYLQGWHATATVGAFSAAAACGRLLGFSPRQLQTAWGIASTQSAGLLRNFGSMSKPLQAGQAARAGVVAALLAKLGMTADQNIFDGEGGMLDAYGDEHSADFVANIADPWEIFEPGIYVKRWPCCYAVHRPLAGLFELIAKHDIRADEVDEVGAGFLPGAAKALIHTNPTDGLAGKFSIEYCAAAALVDRRITLDTFEDSMVTRPEIVDLMPKVKRVDMPGNGIFSGVVGYTDVSVTTKRGRFSTHVPHTPGAPEAPMTHQDRTEKFLDCASRIFDQSRSSALLDLARNIRRLDDVRTLTKHLKP